MLTAGLLYVGEFFADKVPGFDNLWDGVHTFIRIPAGALLAAGASGDLAPAWQVAAALAGGSLAAGSHSLKAGSRLLVNTSPEPFSNAAVSLSEDVIVLGGLWSALFYPGIFMVLLLLFVILLVFLLPKLWHLLRGLLRKLRYAGKPQPPPAVTEPEILPPADKQDRQSR